MPTVRPARSDDYPHYARLFPELAVDDPIPSREKWDQELCRDTLVAEVGGAVVGVCFTQLLEGCAYVRQLMVDPQARRLGAGRALLAEVRGRVQAAGGQRWCLNVKPGNEPAVRLYEAMGMRLKYRSAALRLPWSLVGVLPRTRVKSREVLPPDEARVEQAFGLPAGQLKDARGRGRLLQMLEGAGGEVLGVAAFDRDFPGAFPFRVREARDARALLEALRPLRRPQHSSVGLVVEDDAELYGLLTGFGAELRLEFVHFEGALG